MRRRTFVAGSLATLAVSRFAEGAAPGDALQAEIEKRKDESVKRLQEWCRQITIAAEGKGVEEGATYLSGLLKDAGFQTIERVPNDGVPGVFATLDSGAKKTVGVYFMYDVKQFDAAEWSSPPLEARLVDKANVGKVLMARGAVNQKGPQSAFLAALHALRGAKQKLPVNVVLVAEGEEEIGSPHFKQVVGHPKAKEALKKCAGLFMPSAVQGLDGVIGISLGAKGVIECELTVSQATWGRGPKADIHSANRPRVDSPAWYLVRALSTLVTPDGLDPAIDGFADKARPLSAAEKAMIADAAKRTDEAVAKKVLGVDKWVKDLPWQESLERLMSMPTVNIEGLVSGWTGAGGKTILPGKAVAKLDLRLVPDMTAAEALAALKAHLKKRGFEGVEVKMTGGYDPNSTSAEAPLIKAMVQLYRKAGVEPVMWPRSAGSWPGYVFTGAPLSLAAGHFGLGHGGGAHAPDEYYVIDSANPKVQGYTGAVRSFADFLHALA